MKVFKAAMLLSLVGASSALFAQRAPVNLGTAGNYVALSQTGITDVPPSVITGNIGTSPITGAALHLTCAEVNGTISSVDAAGPAPCSLIAPVALSKAIVDMQTAYTDAAGRTIPDFTELGAGDISGKTLVAGLYKWSTGVSVSNAGVTLQGSPNDVWIFQVSGDLTLASNARMTLSGGAQANNVFWQIGGPTGVTAGTGAVVSGNLLSAKQVILNTGASLNGRAYAQTQITLQSITVTNPGPLVGGIPVPVLSCSFGLQPVINAGGILNSASWTSPVAAGSIASVFGNNFGSSYQATSYPLLPSLGGIAFEAGGRYAPLYMTSCNQVNLQIPWETAGLSQVAMTETNGVLIAAPQPAALAMFAPGIFTTNRMGTGQGAIEVAASGLLAAPQASGAAPVARGQYIAIYCTGLGPVSNQPATGAAASASPLSFTSTLPVVTIGGVQGLVTFSGLAPGFAGLYQVNVQVPANVAPGNAVGLTMSIGGVPSNGVTVAVQ